MPDTARRWFAERVVPALPRPRGTLRREIVPRRRAHAGGCVLRQLRGRAARPPARAARSAACARAPRVSGRTAARARWLDRPQRRSAARPHALRRHQDLPGRTADEAGPDEHGGIDREPRAVPRSQAGRVRRDDAHGVEALGVHDEARAARGGEGPAARRRSSAGRRWDFRCRSASGRADHGTAWSATCCSIAARASAGSSTPAQVTRLLDDHAAGRTEGGDILWSLLNLELWYRTWIDGDGVQHLAAPSSAAATPADARARTRRQPCRDALTTYEDSLAQRRPAPAARQGRQAAHVAPDAPPCAPASHHVPLVCRP